MSDLRSPGNPGGTRGKSESQKNSEPITSTNSGGSAGGGHVASPVTPGRTTANRNKIH